ncbi:sulfatase-like hydrolase/transferase [Microbacterium sp. LWS13-1.2]|uniref:Sulfatase-like hydrolase/transferase n=1 Tax=Microbacterium sp. LWS13-1.2 TaxID=3135264 RepID=A0AAU6S9K8_9MICO
MADELRADALSCYGNTHPEISTPHIDALAARGVLFERAYTSSPVCVPARQAMLAGQSPLDSGVLNNEGYTPAGWTEPEMFPETLAQAGWATRNFGKEHLPGGRSPWQSDDHSGAHMGDLLQVARQHGAEIVRTPEIGHVISARLPQGVRLGSEVITESTVNCLADTDAPFLVRASFVQPHKPMVVPEPWASRYADLHFDAPRRPDNAPNAFQRAWGELTQGAALSDEEAQLSFQQYHACVAWLDDQVGQIMTALDEHGLRESTIVIFTTDHGASLGEDGVLAKHTFAPESHRVPLIFSWPGVLPENTRRGDLTVSEDLANTVLGLAGVQPPASMTGRDLFREGAPDHVLSAIGYGDASSRAFPNRDAGSWNDGRGWPQRVCVRTERYRLDVTTRRGGQLVAEEERDGFFADTLVDQQERTNRIALPEYQRIIDEMLGLALNASAAIPEPDVRADLFEATRAATKAV